MTEEFKNWFEDLKTTAQNDFGYEPEELAVFENEKSKWEKFFRSGYTPFESMLKQMKEKV